MRVRVQVTDEDILVGKPRDPARCPVARASARATGLAARVGPTSLTLSGTAYPLPGFVEQWVGDFDAGRPVGLLTFDVDLPEAP
jgi:hypothetical protein